jgi:hypothetical protein
MGILLRATIYVSITVVLVWLFLTLFGPYRKRFSAEKLEKTGKDGAPRTCPLCGEVLVPGERVKSRVNPGKGDKLMQIYGCPHCYPPNIQCKRICPVCKKEVPREGYVIARLFESPGRRHVHVLGCSGCRHG